MFQNVELECEKCCGFWSWKNGPTAPVVKRVKTCCAAAADMSDNWNCRDWCPKGSVDLGWSCLTLHMIYSPNFAKTNHANLLQHCNDVPIGLLWWLTMCLTACCGDMEFIWKKHSVLNHGVERMGRVFSWQIQHIQRLNPSWKMCFKPWVLSDRACMATALKRFHTHDMPAKKKHGVDLHLNMNVVLFWRFIPVLNKIYWVPRLHSTSPLGIGRDPSV